MFVDFARIPRPALARLAASYVPSAAKAGAIVGTRRLPGSGRALVVGRYFQRARRAWLPRLGTWVSPRRLEAAGLTTAGHPRPTS